jgi:hypothetical protein
MSYEVFKRTARRGFRSPLTGIRTRKRTNSITYGQLLYPGECHSQNSHLWLGARTSRATPRPFPCRRHLEQPEAEFGRPRRVPCGAPRLPLLSATLPALASALRGREELLRARRRLDLLFALPFRANSPESPRASVRACSDGRPKRQAAFQSPSQASWLASRNSIPPPGNPLIS